MNIRTLETPLPLLTTKTCGACADPPYGGAAKLCEPNPTNSQWSPSAVHLIFY